MRSLKLEYVKANTEFKYMCRMKKIQHEETLFVRTNVLSTCKDSAEFWYLTEKINGNVKSKQSFSIALYILRTHFAILLSSSAVQVQLYYAKPYLRNELLDAEILKEEVNNVLDCLKMEKQQGRTVFE